MVVMVGMECTWGKKDYVSGQSLEVIEDPSINDINGIIGMLVNSSGSKWG